MGRVLRRILLAPTIVLTLLLGPVSGIFAQEAADAEAVLRAREAALLDRNIEGVLELFADDADVTTSSGRRFTDKPGIRGWIQEQVDRNQREEVVGNRRTQGDRLVWSGRVYRTDWQNLGVSPLEVTQEAVVKDGRIRLFITAFTPESAARLNAARSAAQPPPQPTPATAPVQAPSTLPRTGSAAGSIDLVAPLAALGGVLVVVGLAVRRRR
jgi:hypothetical protein